MHCPETKEVRPMSDCLKCIHHVENGVSIEWCGYRWEAPARTEIPVNALRLQMEENIRKAESMYKRGWVKLGDSYSFEATKLLQEIRRRSNAKKTS